MKTAKKTYTVKITYFDVRGHHQFDVKVKRTCRPNKHTGACNLQDVAAWVRGIVRDGGNCLPGTDIMCRWDGPILLESAGDAPLLVMPEQ